MNKKKYEENYELIQELAGATNESVEILRSQTLLLENAVNKTIEVVDTAKELSDHTFDEIDTLGDDLIDILNTLEDVRNTTYDAYFAALEKIDPEPWEKLEGGRK